jgi:hypothetical protein
VVILDLGTSDGLHVGAAMAANVLLGIINFHVHNVIMTAETWEGFFADM